MNYKQKFGYITLGAAITVIGMVVGSVIAPPLVAQHNGVFDEVKCRQLIVVDEVGNREILLSNRGISIFNKAGKFAIGMVSAHDSNSISTFDKDGNVAIALTTNQASNVIAISDVQTKKQEMTLAVGKAVAPQLSVVGIKCLKL